MNGTCPESWTTEQDNKVYSMFKMPFRRKSWFAITFFFFQNFSSNSVYKNVHLAELCSIHNYIYGIASYTSLLCQIIYQNIYLTN